MTSTMPSYTSFWDYYDNGLPLFDGFFADRKPISKSV